MALLTDGRFSGFSSGPCIGHIGPEAMVGGPYGRVRDGDIIDIYLNRKKPEGSINIMGDSSIALENADIELGNSILEKRSPREDLAAHPDMPKSVRLWSILQESGGGIWGGCVNDVDSICKSFNHNSII
ncbi:MAG: hypothetical protein GY786_14910 [Proteobacteria bacterium]|nr:hypothetical protein [Pseudomonadota bacterium]